MKRGLPHATGRGEWSGGRGTQIRIGFVLMWALSLMEENFQGLPREESQFLVLVVSESCVSRNFKDKWLEVENQKGC